MSAVHTRRHHTSPEAIIGWRVNGLSFRQFPDITTGSINEDGAIVYTLTIPARSWCVWQSSLRDLHLN